MRAAIVLAAMSFLPALASAQLIKCVGSDGAVAYSDRPCQAGAKPAEVKAPEIMAPTAAAAAEAQAVRQREAVLAERYARDRKLADLQSRLVQIDAARSDIASERETRIRAARCREARRNMALSGWSSRGGMPQVDVLAQSQAISQNCGM